MTEDDYPRDPSKISPTPHAVIQMKDRQIGMRELRMGIKTGIVNPERGDGENTVLYRSEYPGVDLLLAVNTERMEVKSIFYDNEQGATDGSLFGEGPGIMNLGILRR